MKILVVEDDRLLNNTLCYNLSTTEFVVDRAVSKKEAEHFCEKQEYDLIVLDINLPDGNGFDFCHEIKERWPGTAVIFLKCLQHSQSRPLYLNSEKALHSPFFFHKNRMSRFHDILHQTFLEAVTFLRGLEFMIKPS